MSQLFSAITQTLNNHRIFLPREWVIVFRALVTLDGVGKSLHFDFNLFGILEEDIAPLLKSTVKKEDLIEELSWLSKDYISLLRTVPRHTKWFLKEFSKNHYQFKIRNYGYEKQITAVGNSIFYLANTLLAFALIILGIAFMFLDHPISLSSRYWPTWLAFGMAVGLWFVAYIRTKKN
jgi:ubiquinone biosynthesis protein